MGGSPWLVGLIGAAVALYAASAALATGRLLGRPWARRGARATLAAGFALVTTALAAAAATRGSLPVATVPEACLVLIWSATGVYLVLDATRAIPALGTVLLPVVLLLFVAAGLLALRHPAGAPPVDDALILGHVAAALGAYAAFFLAFGAGVLYLVQERQIRSRAPGPIADRLPPLARLDRITYGALLAGLPLLTVALLVGFYAASGSLGAADLSRDPKVAASLVLWLFYATLLGLRTGGAVRGRRVALLTVAGFATVLATLVGTSVLGTGHTTAVLAAERP
ncbi:MAG: cytochrome c biogenesis protein [Planctomycetales bacterium]|nr:cytochrome c biogenesis protein [Planctomycetales bacterium]